MILNNDYCICLLDGDQVAVDNPQCPRHHGVNPSDVPGKVYELKEIEWELVTQ